MNEAPLPTQSVLTRSLPPPPPFVDQTRGPSRLRTSLAACSAEGLAAEVVGACFGNAVVTAWGVAVGASPLLLGVLWGLPHFGQVFQLPASWVTSRFGRKRVAVVMHSLARQITLPIAVLPFVDASIDVKRAVLVTLFALSSLLSVIGHNAWLAWMGDLVPARVRGAYFGRRTAMCTAVATVASLAIAFALDAGRVHSVLGKVLAATIVGRSLAGAVTTVLMLQQHDPSGRNVTPALRDLTLPITDRAYRKLLAYRGAWGIATGLTASLSAVFTLRALGLGFFGVAMYAAVVAVLRVFTTPLWGRALDRAGARPVLVACTLGAALSTLAWVGATAGSAWLIAIDALVCGLLLGGQELAVFTLPLASAPSERRPVFAAASVMVGGVAYGLSSVAGGALAGSMSVRTLLVLSSACRLLATVLATRLEEPRARRPRSDPPALLRDLRDSRSERLAFLSPSPPPTCSPSSTSSPSSPQTHSRAT
ncbi:MAG TPA: MFS transporter [Labilithrix sp.]|nr:MFS transporter [Labilithrix sp.]